MRHVAIALALFLSAFAFVPAAWAGGPDVPTPMIDTLDRNGFDELIVRYPTLVQFNTVGLPSDDATASVQAQIRYALGNARDMLAEYRLGWNAVRERRVTLTSAEYVPVFERIARQEFGQDTSTWGVRIKDAPLMGEAHSATVIHGAVVGLDLVAIR